MSDAQTSYDEVLYPGNPIGHTHPDLLASVATLYGMQPAPASRCRFLELGCGIGGNLLALAYQLPRSEFIGVDLSASSIEIGQKNIKDAGLRNIVLQHRDLTQIGQDFGEFDYIIAHGVYSWVPPAVRGRLLEIYKANLAPQGVGYVSYNAYPGCYLRNVVRDMMVFHTRGLDAPQEKIEQAKTFINFAAEVIPKDKLHGGIVRDQLKRIQEAAPAALYHDDLEPNATPFMLHEVAEAAAAHGLQYLGDTRFGIAELFGLHKSAVEFISQFPKERQVEREQYVDFVAGRPFRRTLLCHDGVTLNRDTGPDRMREYLFAGRVAPLESNPMAAGVASFRTGRGTLRIDHPAAKAALVHLGEIWPQCIAFDDLLHRVSDSLKATGSTNEVHSPEPAVVLAHLLFRTCVGGQIELHLEAPPLTTVIADYPMASLVARKQVANGATEVTNLRHTSVALKDEITRRFLTLVDGTRDRDALVADLNAELAARDASSPRITREQVEKNLQILARLALLSRDGAATIN